MYNLYTKINLICKKVLVSVRGLVGEKIRMNFKSYSTDHED